MSQFNTKQIFALIVFALIAIPAAADDGASCKVPDSQEAQVIQQAARGSVACMDAELNAHIDVAGSVIPIGDGSGEAAGLIQGGPSGTLDAQQRVSLQNCVSQINNTVIQEKNAGHISAQLEQMIHDNAAAFIGAVSAYANKNVDQRVDGPVATIGVRG